MMKHETVEPITWDFNLARRMREAGVSLAKLADIFGLSPDTVHCRLDPEFRAHRRKQVNDRRRYDSAVFAYRHYGDRVKEADVAARRAETPEDNRDYTARMFGDPVFARSAAAQRPKTVQRNGITLPHVSILSKDPR